MKVYTFFIGMIMVFSAVCRIELYDISAWAIEEEVIGILLLMYTVSNVRIRKRGTHKK